MRFFGKKKDRVTIAGGITGNTYRITNVQGCTMIKVQGEWFRYMCDDPLGHGDRVRVVGHVNEVLQVEPA